MRVKAATIAAALLVVALLVNHWWVGVQMARIAAAAGRPPGAPMNDFGVDLPGYMKFLVKLDHLAVAYGFVLIPLAWVAFFVVASIVSGLGDLLGGPKPAGIAEARPVEP
jgi:hypothetical protein